MERTYLVISDKLKQAWSCHPAHYQVTLVLAVLQHAAASGTHNREVPLRFTVESPLSSFSFCPFDTDCSSLTLFCMFSCF